LVAQSPGLPTPVGSFNVTQLGDAPDKIGKDTNFRGLSMFNNVIYYTKGSGGNGREHRLFRGFVGVGQQRKRKPVGLPQRHRPTVGVRQLAHGAY
jgi:hypothetical protein